MVFDFVAQRLLRAWRPQEFDQACVEMSQKPQRLLDLVLLIAIGAINYVAYYESWYEYVINPFPTVVPPVGLGSTCC